MHITSDINAYNLSYIFLTLCNAYYTLFIGAICNAYFIMISDAVYIMHMFLNLLGSH